jgi:hypothetical protein
MQGGNAASGRFMQQSRVSAMKRETPRMTIQRLSNLAYLRRELRGQLYFIVAHQHLVDVFSAP